MQKETKFFLYPSCTTQKHYEALRAFYLENLPVGEIARKFSFSEDYFYLLAHRSRPLQWEKFFVHKMPGVKPLPKTDPTRQKIIDLRKQNFSIYDIQAVLRQEGISRSHRAIYSLLREEGFARLPRRPDKERPELDTPKPVTPPIADRGELDISAGRVINTDAGGIFLFLPFIVQLQLPRIVRSAGYPGSSMIPPLSYILSGLAMKLEGKERWSHIMDCCFDEGLGLFAGLNVIPKKSAMTDYSYRFDRKVTLTTMRMFFRNFQATGLLPGKSFNLDFHAIPHYGEDTVLEKNYVTRRDHAERSVLAFLAQDGSSRVLCYSNSCIRSNDRSSEILNFIKFWEQIAGKKPPCLVFDSQLTTYNVLRQVDQQHIHFITLRRRSQKMLARLLSIPKKEWKTVSLDLPQRKFQKPKVIESTVTPEEYGSPLRQLAVKDLGHDEPTIIITNDFTSLHKDIIIRYAQRMLIENALSENIAFFHIDALTSGVALNVDFDLSLTLIANALYKLLASKIKGFEHSQAKRFFRSIINIKAKILIKDLTVTVQFERRRYNPHLLQAGFENISARIPWWNNKKIIFTFR